MIGLPEVAAATPPLLEVRDLAVRFRAPRQIVHAVNGVSLTVRAGATLGIVGESGCGKSATGLAMMRLLPAGIGWVETGQILFEQANLLALDERQMRGKRGAEIAMIFQDPMSSLNPVMTIGDQVVEAIRAHRKTSYKAASGPARELLAHVGIPAPREIMRRYPHELSGGMRQRVMIAAAIALKPKLIIADEPTTALDPTIQAQVLELLKRLVDETGAALILIAHDLGIVAELADEVAVMYAGMVVERAPAADLFQAPRHPYTLGLLRSRPNFDERTDTLLPIEGSPPVLNGTLTGCPFAPRCSRRSAICSDAVPHLSADVDEPGAHAFACHNPLHPAAASRPSRSDEASA